MSKFEKELKKRLKNELVDTNPTEELRNRIYLENGIDGLQSLKRGRPSMPKKKIEININKADEDKSREELLEELKLARIENEYLKKLSALVQERKAQEQKKK